MCVYRVLAWNSRWLCPIGLTQSDLMTSVLYGTADWFSPVSIANELSAQHSNIWLVLAVAVRSMLQKPSIFPSFTYIDLVRSDSCMLYLIYAIFAATVFLPCSQQHAVAVLTVASLGTCSAAAAQKIYFTKTKYINIVMYATIPPRVVMI